MFVSINLCHFFLYHNQYPNNKKNRLLLSESKIVGESITHISYVYYSYRPEAIILVLIGSLENKTFLFNLCFANNGDSSSVISYSRTYFIFILPYKISYNVAWQQKSCQCVQKAHFSITHGSMKAKYVIRCCGFKDHMALTMKMYIKQPAILKRKEILLRFCSPFQ